VLRRVRCLRAVGRGLFIMAAMLLGASAKPQEPVLDGMLLLARVGCDSGAMLEGTVGLETGYIAMLGMAEKGYSFRVMNHGQHTLMLPAQVCGERNELRFILSHVFQNEQRVREGYYYLTNSDGALVRAVHYREGRSHLFAYIKSDLPVHRADFEAEKIIWFSKAGELAGLRMKKLGDSMAPSPNFSKR
jgi:hypothetical protein